MDADDEIPSHPSPDTDSPSPPHHDNGRIAVTVAAIAQPSPHPSHNSLTLALPIQQPRTETTITATTAAAGSGSTAGGSSGGAGGGGGGGREDCWSEGATSVLIDAWGERYLELSRGNLKQKHWREVADIVSSREDYSKPPKSDIQCKNRIDTVKKKYKIEKAKIAGGGPPSRWPFFERLERLLGPTVTGKTPTQTPSGAPARPSSSVSSSHKIPIGIPVVGVRSVSVDHYSQHNQPFSSAPPPLNPRFTDGYNNSTIKQQQQRQPFRKRLPMVVDSDVEPDEPSPDSTDSLPPETYMRRKFPRVELNTFNPASGRVERGGGSGGNGGGGLGGKEKEKGWGQSVRELTNAILKFGEAYEQAESAKLQQMVEMEKQRMKFAKELELQRMKFLMKTQLELSQLSKSSGRRVGENNNHHSNSNNNDYVNNCDSSNQ